MTTIFVDCACAYAVIFTSLSHDNFHALKSSNILICSVSERILMTSIAVSQETCLTFPNFHRRLLCQLNVRVYINASCVLNAGRSRVARSTYRIFFFSEYRNVKLKRCNLKIKRIGQGILYSLSYQ